MRRFPRIGLIALIALSACEGNALPEPYRDLAVPEAGLGSAQALTRGR